MYCLGAKMKDRMKKTGKGDRREASTSPQSACSELDQQQMSPDPADRSRSNGAMYQDELSSRSQMGMFSDVFPGGYPSVQNASYQQNDGGYSSQQLDSATLPYSYSNHAEGVDSFLPYVPNASVATQTSINGTYHNSTSHRPYHVPNGSISAPRGQPLSPTSPTAQSHLYIPRSSAYPNQMAQQAYGSVPCPYGQGYAESDTSVMLSDFFYPTYCK